MSSVPTRYLLGHLVGHHGAHVPAAVHHDHLALVLVVKRSVERAKDAEGRARVLAAAVVVVVVVVVAAAATLRVAVLVRVVWSWRRATMWLSVSLWSQVGR